MQSYRLTLAVVFAAAFLMIACSEDCPVCPTAPPPTGQAPPPGTDETNVCNVDECATDSQKSQDCQTFLTACLLTEPADECVPGAWFIYCKVDI